MNSFSGAEETPAIFAGGTFRGNPLTMAGGIGALEYLRDNKETILPLLA